MAPLITTARRLLAPYTSWRPSNLLRDLSCTAPLSTLRQSPPSPTSSPPRLRRQLQPPGPAAPSSRRALTSLLSSILTTSTANPNSNPQSTPPQTLHARRVLPFPVSHLYTIIADIDSYRHFLPHCTASQVTAWTAATTQQQQQQRWPALADLTVGWGLFTQSYTSRVYCVPGEIVEAVSGSASTTIPTDRLRQIGYDVSGSTRARSPGMSPGIFDSLVTRWTVRPAPAGRAQPGALQRGGEWTEVTLSIQFRFANPALGFAVGQLADDKVDDMVQAFEERAKRLYGKKS